MSLANRGFTLNYSSVREKQMKQATHSGGLSPA